MNSILNTTFDQVIVIHLDRRTDRMEHISRELSKHPFCFEIFHGFDGLKDETLKVNGNCGCTASHRAVLDTICFHGWDKTLVLEDDFHILHDDFEKRFHDLWELVPSDWDIVYLGGHYADRPQRRINPHVVKVNRMHTTSSYAIRLGFARDIAPHIFGKGPIDCLFSGFLPSAKAYCLQPRLMVQYPSFSDLLEQQSDYQDCMTDTTHERMV